MSATTTGEHSVVIAGAGPTGMMLGAELTIAGIDVVVIERRRTPELEGPRARGFHSRTIEILDQRGIAGRVLAAGRTAQIQSFAGVPLDISDFPTRHPYGIALLQSDFERILAEWIGEIGVKVLRDREVTGFAQDADGVDVAVSDGTTLRTQFLVGCDGGRSVVRKTAGIEFAGTDASVYSLIAEVEFDVQPEWGIRYDDEGTQAVGPADGGKRAGFVVTQPYTGQSAHPTMDDLRAAVVSVWGTDFGMRNPAWISRFTDATRQAVAYRAGRVLLAGDAAHTHYPVGGQGLNLGVQDAVNLGWKLAQVVKGLSPEGLLDTYQAERYPVAERALRQTMAMTTLARGDARTVALREVIAEVLESAEARRRLAGTISSLDIRYGDGEGHPLVGRRMPDLEVGLGGEAVRVFSLLHDGRGLLLLFGDGATPPEVGGRVRVVDATYEGAWELPVIGTVDAPKAVLVRPDGHVAWAGDPRESDLAEALTAWFGAAA